MEGAGLLDSTTMTLISKAFTDLKDTVVQVLAVSIPAAVAIIGVSAGANYALGKIRGVLGWA